jgi:hypothetical protein
MTRIVLAIALTLSFAACGATPPLTTSPTRNLSAAGLAAFQSTKVVKALDVLRDVAVEAEKQHLLSTDTTRKVVTYHLSAVKTIGAVPSGWQTVVGSGLVELGKNIPAAEWKQLEPFANLITTVLHEVSQ